jgi:hypothetical protein
MINVIFCCNCQLSRCHSFSIILQNCQLWRLSQLSSTANSQLTAFQAGSHFCLHSPTVNWALNSDTSIQFPSSHPGRLASWNSTDLNDLLCPFYNPSAQTAQKHSFSTVACICFRGNVFTQLFHSNGCMRHIQFLYCCVRWNYLAMAVSLAPQFLL